MIYAGRLVSTLRVELHIPTIESQVHGKTGHSSRKRDIFFTTSVASNQEPSHLKRESYKPEIMFI